MEDNKRSTIIRYGVIFFILVAFGIYVLVSIFHTQHSHRRDQLIAIAQRTTSRNEVIEANRGNIYDCNGNLLAGSSPKYRIYMDTSIPALQKNKGQLFYDNIDSLSIALAACIGDRTAREYKDLIVNAYKKKNSRLRLTKEQITYQQLKAVKQMPLYRLGKYKGGLIEEEYYRRIKPYGMLASRTIGNIYGGNGKGNSGLEKAFETQLHGVDGHKQMEMIDGRMEVLSNTEAEDGLDIVTTIDADLQDIVESQLLYKIKETNADNGCCILMEVKTGEVKAIANIACIDGEYVENRNYATIRIEPGSTFKTFSLMAVLDEGRFDLEDSLYLENGKWIYKDQKRPITDSHAHGMATVLQAFAASSNIGLAKLVTETYDQKASRFVDKLDRMGVRDSIIFEIPGTNQPVIEVPKDQETLSRMAFGYSVELPPIAILMFYNAIANDGKMIRPFLVKEIQRDGETLETFKTSVVRSSICKESTLRDVKKGLEAVVWDNEYGTASVNPSGRRKAQSDIVHVAGKTGTARLQNAGNYDKGNHRFLFCGYFPMEAPQYTCIFILERAQYGTDSGRDCGGSVRSIAEKTIAHVGYISIKTKYVDPDSMLLPSIKRGKQSAIRKAAKGTKVNIEYTDDEWVKVNGAYQAEAISVKPNIVPNVVGMGAKDAVYAIEQTGMVARIKGRGKVVSQSVPNGSAVVKGGVVYLDLRP